MDWRMGTFFEIESISPLLTPRDFGIPLLYILRPGISVGVRARGKRERIAQPRQFSFDINSPPKVHTGNILYKVYTIYNCHLSAPPIDT